MRKTVFIIFLILYTITVKAQQKTENIIIITTDGLRWQEVFTGMDSAIANNKLYNQGDSAYIYKNYWSSNSEARREKLMPFFWSTLQQQGQLYGNRLLKNKVDNANRYWFSYPGYNEIFTGYPDTAVNSNDYPNNPHTNVLEYIHQLPAYKNKVAAFTAWDAFNRILNEPRCGFPVIAAFDTVSGKLNEKQKLVNNMLLNSFRPWKSSECLDMFTHYAALEYLKTRNPKVLYIAYGETDEWAHAGEYRYYLDAAQQVDKWIEEIWNYIQTHKKYKNKTALLITTDHGRGDKNKKDWTSHGSNITGANEIWFAVMAPGLPAKGEVKQDMQLYQKQMAQTIAKLLGLSFTAEHPVAEAVDEIIESK
ncbi:MAG: phosphoglyceromutase [Segetibacter sp.]|nr:phosphoglyceromutase [Segetibacter sp.]